MVNDGKAIQRTICKAICCQTDLCVAVSLFTIWLQRPQPSF